MSPSNAERPESEGIEAHRLLDTATRLKEVRRRFALDSRSGEKYALTADHLDSVISDLDGWLIPGGEVIDFGGLDLRLAAVQEMIETVGFPGYARVIASVRDGLQEPPDASAAEEEPPPPRRYKPPATSIASRSEADADVDEWEIRAAAEQNRRGRGWLIWPALMVGGAAVAALVFFSQSRTHLPAADRIDRVAVEEPEVLVPTPAPAPTSIPDPPDIEEILEDAVEVRAETLAQFAREVDLAYEAVDEGDLDLGLQHFAAAAEIDRHHSDLAKLAEYLIDVLLKEADLAFDDSEWNLAAELVEDARRIARGLYLDTSAIDNAGRKLADMTRFEDVAPEDHSAFSGAVGHSARVTLTNGDVFFGRLESIDDSALLLEVHTGVEGGGMQFLKSIPLATISELRIFDAERPSETFLGR